MDESALNEQQPPLAPLPSVAQLPFRRPADYYASSGTDLKPLFAGWVPVGCGWASLVLIVAVFIGGSLAPRSGALLEMLFGRIADDMTPHFQPDVTPQQRAEFAAEIKLLRAKASAGTLKLDRTQSFLRLATDVDADEKINHTEADKLIQAVRDINRPAK